MDFGARPKKPTAQLNTAAPAGRWIGGLYIPSSAPTAAVVIRAPEPEKLNLFDAHIRTTGGVRHPDDPTEQGADDAAAAAAAADYTQTDGVVPEPDVYDHNEDFQYRSPLMKVARGAILKAEENLLSKINSHTDGLEHFHGIRDRQARVERAFLNLGKQLGFEHVHGIYVYNNTDVHHDHNGHEMLSNCVLMLKDTAPIGPLASLPWGRHRVVGMLKDGAKSVEGMVAAGSCATLAADSGVRFIDASTIAPEDSLEIEKTSQRPVLGCGGTVSCGGSFNMDSAVQGLTPTFVVTNHSTAAVAQIELALDKHPRTTADQFFRDRMYGTAIARGQRQALRMLELIATKSVTVNYLAPMVYMRRVFAENAGGGGGGEHLYAVHMDMFGPTDHMLPSNTLMHSVREQTRHYHVGYTVDGGSQVGFLVYTPNVPVTYPDLAGLIVHGDLDSYKSEPQRGRLPDEDYGNVSYGLPSRVFFSDINRTLVDKDVRIHCVSRIMPYQCSKALVTGRHAFQDQKDQDFHAMATTAFNSLYGSTMYTLSMQIKAESHYATGICRHRCGDSALVHTVHGPPHVTVPATNTCMWDMIHELLRLAALESTTNEKSKSLYDDVPESGAVYRNRQVTLSHAWILEARAKYRVKPTTVHKRAPHHGHTSAMAVHIAEQFSSGDEAAHLAHYLSHKTTDD